MHPACLIRWQRSAPRTRSTARDTCEVCNVAWAVPLQPLDRLCWVRGLRTNPRYPAVDDALSEEDRAAALALMRPGTLILQSPARSVETGRDMGVAAGAVESDASALALFAATIRALRAHHWHKGVYLIVHVGAGEGEDGSDSIVAVNIAGSAARESSPAAGAPFHTHTAFLLHCPFLSRSAPVASGPGREDADTRAEALTAALREAAASAVLPVHTLRGGPCNSREVLCLLPLQPQVRRRPARPRARENHAAEQR